MCPHGFSFLVLVLHTTPPPFCYACYANWTTTKIQKPTAEKSKQEPAVSFFGRGIVWDAIWE